VGVAAYLARLATVPPQGAATEAAAWQLLADLCGQSLAAYPQPLDADERTLARAAAAAAEDAEDAANSAADSAAAAGGVVAAARAVATKDAAATAASTRAAKSHKAGGPANDDDGSDEAASLVQFSNAWNATVQVRGEKRILAKWRRFALARAYEESQLAELEQQEQQQAR
jgi:hypothetical protein